jgi:hypothetical protein
MSMVISCDAAALNGLAVRLRQVAEQVRSHDARLRSLSGGRAFAGALPQTLQSFEELREQTRRSGHVLAGELEALAGALDAGALAFLKAQESLVSSLNGFLTQEP